MQCAVPIAHHGQQCPALYVHYLDPGVNAQYLLRIQHGGAMHRVREDDPMTRLDLWDPGSAHVERLTFIDASERPCDRNAVITCFRGQICGLDRAGDRRSVEQPLKSIPA